jgi:2-polyprenyl-6-methoxyphenol hydroxylase-like FAD-dependent oxidoreductase
MRILQQLGLADRILAEAGVMDEIRWVDQRGLLINEISIADRECPAVALHRADLQSTLLEALPASSIHLGKSIVRYSEDGKKVIATFADGTSVEADVLIGADGIHSDVRSQFLNDGEPIFRGYTVWRGISTATPADVPPATAIEFYGGGKRFGLGPVGLGRTGWWASANGHYATNDLHSSFKDWPRSVVQLIETTPSASILKTEASDRRPSRNWGTGRMTLLGDAIHPTTPNLGQGGCLAMEDAVVLAQCFQMYGVCEEALRTYERMRYKRTAAITRYSRIYGNVGQWENVFARALRRTALSLIPEATARRVMENVFYPQVTQS